MQMLLRFLQTVEHFFCLRFVEAVRSKRGGEGYNGI